MTTQAIQIYEDREFLIDALLGQYLVDGNAHLAEQIADSCTVESFEAGTEMIVQGDERNDIFLILQGSVSVCVHGRQVAERSAGQHVGEMALINPGARRSASVVPLEPVVAARLSEPDFTRMANGVPRMWRSLAGDLGTRVDYYNEHGAHLEFVAHHDTLTLLPNRNLFMKRLNQAIDHARKSGSEVALLYLDLDKFKPVNDTYGHAMGDQLLKLVAERIRHCARKTDTVARFGGDEFTMLLTGPGSRENSSMVAEKLVDHLGRLFRINGVDLAISASVGIAYFPDHGNDADTLMQRADHALYSAKRSGRDGYRLWA